MASVRSCWKLPPCPLEPVPPGSKTDLPLAKAISDGCSASGTMYLRKKKILHNGILQQEGGVRRCERNNSAATKANAEGGEEVLQAPEQRFPCSLWSRPW